MTNISLCHVLLVVTAIQSSAFSLLQPLSPPSALSKQVHRPISTTQLAATVTKTEEEWRASLTPAQYNVLRQEGTEPPNTSPLNLIKSDGTFVCAGCNSPLFVTSTKFDSGTGWPSFYAPIDANSVNLSTDFKLVIPRTEVT
eukprot:8337998-Ditylum_brightwellii.AAC.1